MKTHLKKFKRDEIQFKVAIQTFYLLYFTLLQDGDGNRKQFTVFLSSFELFMYINQFLALRPKQNSKYLSFMS